MKLFLFSFFAVFLSISATAETQGIINDAKAVVLVQGSDTDAKHLFDSMQVESVGSGGRLTKAYKITSNSGDEIFNIVCNWAPSTNVGSCTLTFVAWRYRPVDIEINRGSNYVLLQAGDKYIAKNIASSFTQSDEGVIFQSENTRLRIWANKNHLGEVTRFTILYDN